MEIVLCSLHVVADQSSCFWNFMFNLDRKKSMTVKGLNKVVTTPVPPTPHPHSHPTPPHPQDSNWVLSSDEVKPKQLKEHNQQTVCYNKRSDFENWPQFNVNEI